MTQLKTYRTLRPVFMTALSLSLLTSSCFLKPKKKSASSSGNDARLIVRDSIFMDRFGDGDKARLRFSTRSAGHCEMAFYSQEDKGTPSKGNPKILPCSNINKAQTDFVEQIDGLKTDSLYFVKLTAWETGGSKEKGDVVLVKEAVTHPDIVKPGNSAADGKFKELLVARFDIPLKSAEVHRHQLKEPSDVATIKSQLKLTTGCRQGILKQVVPYRDAMKDIGIKGLTTRDYAAGTAINHIDYPERLRLDYASLNEGLDKWSLIYEFGDKDVMVTARPMTTIQNMEMESADIMLFEDPQLENAADPLRIDLSKPLKISWTTTGSLLEQSYMSVLIGRPEYEKAIYCVFDAEKRSGTVDAALLQSLDEGKHVLFAELASSQIWVKDGWLITTYDWRSSRIER